MKTLKLISTLALLVLAITVKAQRAVDEFTLDSIIGAASLNQQLNDDFKKVAPHLSIQVTMNSFNGSSTLVSRLQSSNDGTNFVNTGDTLALSGDASGFIKLADAKDRYYRVNHTHAVGDTADIKTVVVIKK
jgi:hypothetical protein